MDVTVYKIAYSNDRQPDKKFEFVGTLEEFEAEIKHFGGSYTIHSKEQSNELPLRRTLDR